MRMRWRVYWNYFKVDCARSMMSIPFVVTVLLTFISFLYMTIGMQREEASITFLFVQKFSDVEILISILATLPYVTSFAVEWRGVYYLPTIARTGANGYLITRCITTALSSGFSVVIGASLYLAYLCFTAQSIVPTEETRYVELSGFAFSSWMTEHEMWKFFLMKLIIIFLYSMACAAIGLAATAFVPNKYIACVAPYATIFLFNRISIASNGFEWLDLRRMFAATIPIDEFYGWRLCGWFLLHTFAAYALFVWRAKRRIANG